MAGGVGLDNYGGIGFEDNVVWGKWVAGGVVESRSH